MNGGGSTVDCDVTIHKHTHAHTHTHYNDNYTPTPQCPLSHYAQERLRPCPQAQIGGPINILYVGTCPVVALG